MSRRALNTPAYPGEDRRHLCHTCRHHWHSHLEGKGRCYAHAYCPCRNYQGAIPPKFAPPEPHTPAWDDEASAQQAADDVQASRGAPLEPRHCYQCGRWHLRLPPP